VLSAPVVEEGAISLRVPSKRPRSAWECLRDSVLADVAERYRRYLHGRGYTALTIANHLGRLAHFAYWLTCTGRRVSDINEALIGRFLHQHRPTRPCAQRPRQRREMRNALTLLLQWLRQERLVADVVPRPQRLQRELDEFEGHLSGVCGLAPQTRDQHLGIVRRFLSSQFTGRPIKLSRVTAEDIRGFVEQYAQRWRPISLRAVGVALRGYLRFKALGGAVVEPLVAAIPRVPRWALANLPETLTLAQIERFLAAIDRTRPKGLRDYAMARCVIDLGLRAVEITRLRLEDVDWSEGTLAIRGKGRRVERLPLPKTLGAALVRYLRYARPCNGSRALFVRWRAPRRELTRCAIGEALRDAAQRRGLKFTGLRVFRHTLACRLLARGASLKAIADVLRHRSFDTTTIYAKVDLAALKRVAMPWPERLA
jgi:integrase/recombinase XerD